MNRSNQTFYKIVIGEWTYRDGDDRLEKISQTTTLITMIRERADRHFEMVEDWPIVQDVGMEVLLVEETCISNRKQERILRYANVQVPDGVYFLFPHDSAWEAAYFRNSKLMSATTQKEFAEHNRVNDWWADISPNMNEVEVSCLPVATAIIRQVTQQSLPIDPIVVTKMA